MAMKSKEALVGTRFKLKSWIVLPFYLVSVLIDIGIIQYRFNTKIQLGISKRDKNSRYDYQ